MAKAELSQVVKELMTKPEQIRNIGIVAHIDHGKCIGGDSRLYKADGEHIKADNLFRVAEEEGIIVRKTETETVYDISHENIEVFSLNKERGVMEKKPVKYAWKLKGGRVIRVKLRNGYEIKTTPEHKYIVFDGNGFVEKRAEDLKMRERIACPRELRVNNGRNVRKLILLKLSKKGFFVTLKDSKKLKRFILEKGREKIREMINAEISGNSIYHAAYRGSIILRDYIDISLHMGLNYDQIIDNIEWISYRSGTRRRGKNCGRMRFPEKLEDFYYLAGLMAGDGTGNKLVVGKEPLGRAFKAICTDMGINCAERDYEGKTKELCTNKTMLEVLNSVFSYPKRAKSHNIEVSRLLMLSDDRPIARFISGYFDCDGTVEKSRGAISISSASMKMLQGIQMLLLRFGCISSLRGDTLYISGNSVKSFNDNIGFTLEEKSLKAYELEKRVVGSYLLDLVPLDKGRILELQSMVSAYKNHVRNYQRLQYEPTIGTLQKIMKDIKIQGAIEWLARIASGMLAYIEVDEISYGHEDAVYDFTVEDNHNFVAEGMIIHNTTLTDNLLAGAGMMSEELAGKQLAMDFVAQEQERGITIYAANVSMVHTVKGRDYLINLIDTPGHVDFGGDVTRAMRAVDGVVVVADAVEGCMPQTETVLRQALKERVRPTLFINKVDRMIKELKLTPQQMEERFKKIITEVNMLIQKYAEEEYKDKYTVNVLDGSVAFGSALRKWAISVPKMQETGISFKDIIDMTEGENEKELAKKTPLHAVVLEMVIKHLPNPLVAQKYRIQRIWPGESDSPVAKSMQTCDPNGHLAAIVTKIYPDPHAGYVATVRIFSGKIKGGQDLALIGSHKTEKIQQVSIYKGAQRIAMEEVVAGNIVGIIGLKSAFSGETLAESDYAIPAFESIKHIFEPVVTKAVEPKQPKQLAKLIEFLRKTSREDPTLCVQINEDTGEYLVSGLGELHIDAKIERPLKDANIEVSVSPPIVIYKESVKQMNPNAIEGKSPNRHNRFYMVAEPLEEKVLRAMASGEIPSDFEIKKKDLDLIEKLVGLGMDRDEIKKIKLIHNRNVFLDNTHGVTAILEVMEMLKQSFTEAMNEGPLAREPCTGVKVRIVDAKLHEDAIHRGPAQVIPAVRSAIRQAMVAGKAFILEPKQVIRIDVPTEQLSGAMKEVQNRRGQIIEMSEERGATVIKAKLPVAEMFGFNSALKSGTGGQGFFWLIDVTYEPLPKELEHTVVRRIKERKGLRDEELHEEETEE